MKHTMLKCLSIVMALATLLSVCAVPALAANVCQHGEADLKTQIGVQAATCTEPGAEIWECSCGKYVTRHKDSEPALGHNWVEDVDQRIEPTYEPASGKSVYVCDRCDAEKVVLTTKTQCDPGEHDYSVVDTATCDTDGKLIMTCTVCGFVDDTTFSARKGHAFGEGVQTKAPVCGVSGAEYTFTCANDGCEATVVETMPLASNEHKWLAVEANDATCTEAGNTAGSVCVICEAAKDGYTVIDALGHDFDTNNDGKDDPYQDEDHLPVAVGCNDGISYKKCERCNYIHKDTQSALTDPKGNHNPLNAEVLGITLIKTEATCTEAGYYTCILCEKTFEGDAPTDHDWGDTPTEVREATCKDWGYTAWFCPKCGTYKFDDKQAPTGNHVKPTDPNEIHFVDRTCLEDAKTWYICTVCGTKQIETYVDHPDYETTYKALGHDMQDVDYKAPDCSKLPTYKKVVNSNIVTVAVDKATVDAINALLATNGDTSAYDAAVVAAVIEANGHTAGSKCSRCPYGTTSTIIPATHTKSETPADIAATCTVEAHKAYVCTECDVEIEVVANSFVMGSLNPENHGHILTRVEVEADCLTPGTYVKFCEDCGKDTESGTIDPLGHLWGENVTTKKPTCYEKGVIKHTCIRGEVKDPETGAVTTPSPCGATEVVNEAEPTLEELLKHAAHVLPQGATAPTTGTLHALDFYYTTRTVITEGSCVQLQQVEYTCAGCGAKFYTTNEDYLISGDAADLYGEHNKVATLPEAPICDPNEANCKDGHDDDGWQCARCGVAKLPTKIEWSHNPVEIPAVSATHTKDGSTAGVKCDDCGKIITAPETVEAEGHTWQKVVAVLPGCESKGNLEYYKCTGTDNDDPNNIHACTAVSEDGENVATGKLAADYDVDATGHNFAGQEWIPVAANCYQDGYAYQVCKNGCVIENNSINSKEFYYGHAAHTYVVDESKKEPTCGEDGIITTTCSNVDVAHGTATCVYRDVEKVADATGHWNAPTEENPEGQLISMDCTVEMDRHCVLCDQDIEPEHDVSEADRIFQEKACGLPDRYVWACTKCDTQIVEWIPMTDAVTGEVIMRPVEVKDEDGNVLFTDYVPAYDLGTHAWELIENGHKDASYTEDGYDKYHCPLCGADKTDVIPMLVGIDFSISVANNNAGQEKIVDGALIAVKIATTTSEYGVSTLNLKLRYDTNLFKYVGFEADNAFGKASGTATEVDFTKNNLAYATAGVVTMQSVTENTAEGSLQNAVLDGTETYMTLYFRVAANAHDAAAAAFQLAEIEAKQVEDDVITDVDASEIINDDVVDLAGKIYALGNINGDGIENGQADLIAMKSLLLVKDYDVVIDAAADLDQDGKFTICDFALLQKLIVGAITYEQLVEIAASGATC